LIKNSVANKIFIQMFGSWCVRFIFKPI
jgi:hypothetical protein